MTTARQSKLRPVILGFISVGIVYHLLTILLLPNSSSLVARGISRFFAPYANQFGLNTGWVFFSPGPAPVLHLEYEVVDADGMTVGEPIIFPDKKPYTYSDEKFRLLYTMRYYGLSPERVEASLVPWLCRKHEGAAAMSIRLVVDEVPGIQKAWLGDSFEDRLQRRDGEAQTYNCNSEVQSW